MAVTKITEFEDFKIVDAHVRLYDSATSKLGAAEVFGCTGSLTTETESKTIQKTCAGEVQKETTKATKVSCTVNAHVKPSVLIDVMGLTNDGLKEGVYGFAGKKTARGNITFKVLDMYEEKVKYIGFPEVTFGSGLTLDIESGQEEIAMAEIPFSALRDENGYFYYQAYEDDLKDEDVKSTWHTAFGPELVSTIAPEDPVVGG